MKRKQPLWIAAGMLALALGLAACGERGGGGEPGTDAGQGGPGDGGQLADAGGGGGNGDAGVDAGGGHDAGQVTDAGGDPDAGEDLDGGMAEDAGMADAGCGDVNSMFFAVKQQDWGWPANAPNGIPTCYTGPQDCDRIYVRKFTDAVSLETFYQDELQMTAPVINFNLADAVVTYACACPTMGHTLTTHDVVEDGCAVTTITELEKPGETCFVQQTFTRPFSTVEITKSPAPATRNMNTVTVYSCD